MDLTDPGANFGRKELEPLFHKDSRWLILGNEGADAGSIGSVRGQLPDHYILFIGIHCDQKSPAGLRIGEHEHAFHGTGTVYEMAV